MSLLFLSRKIPLESTELLIIEDDGGDVEKTIKTTKNNKNNNQTHQMKNDLSVENLNNNSDGNGDDSEEPTAAVIEEARLLFESGVVKLCNNHRVDFVPVDCVSYIMVSRTVKVKVDQVEVRDGCRDSCGYFSVCFKD